MTYTVLLSYDKICRHGFNFFKVSTYSAHVWFLLDAFPIDISELDLNKGHVRKNSRGIAMENYIIS